MTKFLVIKVVAKNGSKPLFERDLTITDVKRFFSRIDHYYSKISRRRKLKYNLAIWKKYPPIPYCVPNWIENSSETSVFLSYVE